jgi:hypothetical protein
MSLDEKKTLVLSFKEKEATWEFLYYYYLLINQLNWKQCELWGLGNF